MRVSILAAVAANGALGLGKGLPWRLPADLRRFQRLTRGHHLILGRKTWETLPGPLPERRILVVTRSSGYRAAGAAAILRSLAAALAHARAAGEGEVFVGGGAELYRQALPLADRIYLTRIHASFEADTFFPPFDEGRWRLAAREDHAPDEKNRWAYSFLVYDRAAPA